LARPSFDGLVPRFGRQGTARHDHRLEPLDDESAAALCRRLLLPADSVPDAAVKRLIERAENVPLLLVELIRGLKRDGFVRKHRQTGAWHLATDEVERLPDLPVIEWFAQRQIDSLSAPLKEHARLLSLLGPQVTLPEVSAVLDFLDREGMAGEHTLDAKVGVQLLVQAGVLTEDEPGRARFRQELLREAFSRSIPDAQRRQMHLALYHHYEAKSDAELSPWLPQLARHAAAAGLGAAAARAYVTLAEQARARHAYLEAELLYSRALEQTSSGDAALEGVACRGRGIMRYRIERPAEALDDLARARELSRARRDVATEAEILLDQATALDWMLAYKRSSELTEQAAELIAGLDSRLLRAKLSLARGRALQRENRDREAVRVLEDTVAQAERLGDEGYELLVIALLVLGYVLPELHRNDAAECALERAISLSEEHRDRLHLMTAIFNRGQLRGLKNDRPGLVADFTRAIQLARQIGHGTMEWMAETNLGEFLYWLDDLDAAALHNGRALEIDLRRGSKGGSPIALLGAARIRLYRGDEDGARELSARLRASLERGGEDALPRPSDEVLLTMVELALRDAGVAEWEEVIARSARVSAGSERVEVLEVRALSALRRGRLAEAKTSIERAFAVAGQVQHMMAARLSRVRAEIAGGARRSG
jgi:eukaryotic-like serine/threonine-protein kinase